MFIIFIVILVIGAAIVRSTGSPDLGATGRCEDKVDRRHHWVVRFSNEDRRGYLTCKVCGKLPGED